MTIVYGIHNCDTVKKTIKWLDSQTIKHQFHDYRKDGLSHDLLSSFFVNNDWQKLLNKRSTTYRNLPDDIKESMNQEIAFKAILEQPTLLKRPLIHVNNQYIIGFNATQYQEFFHDDK